MDLSSLATELHYRGFGQEMVDSAFRCLVHVHAVQDHASDEKKGILAQDILDKYPLEVVQVASELFLERTKAGPQEAYRVRWGYEEAAATMEEQLWDHTCSRWDEFVSSLDERYLGFFLPPPSNRARLIGTWKLTKDLKWFSIAVPRHGWRILRLINDITAIAWKLDLAFGFRPYGAGGIQRETALLHEKAYKALQSKAVLPPEEFRASVRLWKFFSEYDPEATDFVALTEECGISLDDVVGQVEKFFAKDLTSHYREGQYPPYFVNDKKKKEFQAEMRDLLNPMDSWLSRGESARRAEPVLENQSQGGLAPSGAGESSGLSQLLVLRR